MNLKNIYSFIRPELILLSILVYSYMVNFKFALVFAIPLYLHELGHCFAMWNYGYKVKGIYMIPFLGGVALMDDIIVNRYEEIVISIYGAMIGSVVSFIMLFLGIYYDSKYLIASSMFVSLVNLFNLLPINPLDGGRIVKSILYTISSKIGVVYLYLGILACTYFIYRGLYFVGFFLMLTGYVEFKMESKNLIEFEKTDLKESILVSIKGLVFYLGIICVLYNLLSIGSDFITEPKFLTEIFENEK